MVDEKDIEVEKAMEALEAMEIQEDAAPDQTDGRSTANRAAPDSGFQPSASSSSAAIARTLQQGEENGASVLVVAVLLYHCLV